MHRGASAAFRLILPLCAVLALPATAQQTVGLFVNDEAAFDGYNLMSPGGSWTTYLFSTDGLLVRTWTAGGPPGLMGYLTDEGHLVRATRFNPAPANFSTGTGRGGRIQEYDWDGNLVWQFDYATQAHVTHHDIEPLPNGNLLIIAWEYHTEADAILAGRDPATVNGALWPEKVVEVEPVGATGGNIVWEWRVWDHLIQELNAAMDNFGVVADHPELIDINYILGGGSDWLHANGIDYNPELDQIILSIHNFGEVWVIDHSTTTAEAAAHSGGDSGKGGDLLYRWGNPRAYGRGAALEQQLYGQHDAQWIEPGRPGAGNILVFDNGNNEPGVNSSRVVEIVPPVDGNGDYSIAPGLAFDPAAPFWSYPRIPDTDFYSSNISGAQRQPNGTTLICEGDDGRLFEVTVDEQIVWEYISPIIGNTVGTQGAPPANSPVFKVRRYAADFAGFAGRDLTPGDPIENGDRPSPVPADSLFADKLTPAGDLLRIAWDPDSCQSFDYDLLVGPLANVSSYELTGSECGVGVSGSLTWSGVPDGSLYFVIVGTDTHGVYESSWGTASSGEERFGTRASGVCTSTTKVVSATCP